MLPGTISNLARVRFPPSGTAPGNVDGPSSSTDNALARFDGTTGKLIQNGVVTEADLTGTLTGPASQTTTTAVGIGYTNQPLNDGVEILSNSASDVQTATVIGTTTGGNTTVIEAIVLTGTTPVSTVKTNWGQILAIKLSSAAVGTITIRKATGDATITTLSAAATSSGVTTVTNTAAYNRVVQVVADGATTKQFGFGGTNSAGTQIYDSVALTGTTAIVSNSAFNTLTEMYRGDLEVARTVTQTAASTFSLIGGTTGQLDINSLGVSLPSTQTAGLQLYNTADQVTNYERLEALFTANAATIQFTKGGTGSSRDLIIKGNGTVGGMFTIGGSGTVRTRLDFSGGLNTAGTWFAVGSNTGSFVMTTGTNIFTSLTPTYNQASGNAANDDLRIARVETALGSGVQNFINCLAGAAGTTQKFAILNTGIMSAYAGVATAGWGSPAIYKAGRVTAQSAANASISTYTVGASDGSFEVSANMNVTVATALATTLTCTYTDESNTARTLILPITQLSGSFIALGAITGTGAWETPVMHIRCKASTAITILTSAGTFNTVTYTAEGIIKQTA